MKKNIIAITALLAIFISGFIVYFAQKKSKQLLGKFEEINNSLDNAFVINTARDYSPKNKTKVEGLLKKSETLIGFINEMKDSTIQNSKDKSLHKYLFENKNISKLKEKLIKHKRYLIDNFPDESEEIKYIQTGNLRDGNDSISWEQNYFADTTLSTLITHLVLFQAQTKKVEENILKKLK